jgi:hypothetical protein
MSAIPEEAIAAAAEAILSAQNANDDEPERWEARHTATTALTAGAPVIAAAERERIRKLAVEVDAEYTAQMPDGECDEAKFADLLGGEPS